MCLGESIDHPLNDSFRDMGPRGGGRSDEIVNLLVKLLDVLFGDRSIIVIIALNLVGTVVDRIEGHVFPSKKSLGIC